MKLVITADIEEGEFCGNCEWQVHNKKSNRGLCILFSDYLIIENNKLCRCCSCVDAEESFMDMASLINSYEETPTDYSIE